MHNRARKSSSRRWTSCVSWFGLLMITVVLWLMWQLAPQKSNKSRGKDLSTPETPHVEVVALDSRLQQLRRNALTKVPMARVRWHATLVATTIPATTFAATLAAATKAATPTREHYRISTETKLSTRRFDALLGSSRRVRTSAVTETMRRRKYSSDLSTAPKPIELLQQRFKSNPITAMYADIPDPLFGKTHPTADAFHAAGTWDPWEAERAANETSVTFSLDRAGLPLLSSLLRRFEEFNRRIIIQHRSDDRGRDAATTRIVVVHPVGQLCNRLMAIASGFVFALLTRRGLVVDDSGFYCSMGDLFDAPGWNWVEPFMMNGDASVGRVLQNPEGGTWSEMEPLLCANYSLAYPEPTVQVFMNQYFVPYMANNAHYRSHLGELFGGSTELFFAVSRFLFRPTSHMRRLRNEFIDKHFYATPDDGGQRKLRRIVGLQVRSGGDFTDHFMGVDDWKLYGACGVAGVASASGASDDDVIFFVATDTQKGRDVAIAALGAGRVLFGSREFLLSDHPEGVQMALLDLLILSAAADRVTTAWSSYGYFAAGSSGVPATIVVDEVPPEKWSAAPGEEQRFMGVMHKSDRRAQCVRLPTSQPCFHKFASWGASTASCFKQEWFQREMLNGRYC